MPWTSDSRRALRRRLGPLLGLASIGVFSQPAIAVAGGVSATGFPQLGVLEPAAQGTEHPSCVVHAAFERIDGTWKPLPAEPRDAAERDRAATSFGEFRAWTIGFDGRRVGELKTKRGSWDSSGEWGVLLPSGSACPSVKASGADFHYWRTTSTSPSRPLVAVSTKSVADPERWKPVTVPADTVKKVIPKFREAVPGVPPCDSATDRALVSYPDKRIGVGKSYASAAGVRLVQLSLQRPPADCNDGPPDPTYDSRWFLVRNDEVRLVGQALELIDAGDYDSDGHSEVVFHRYGYDYDGYVLLFDNLKKQAEFGWTYH